MKRSQGRGGNRAATPCAARIDRDAYIYNTISGLLVAFQSVILLMVITRVGNLAMAGVFTIAYANANLFLNVGKYGMRNYQASDVLPSYSFASYGASRLVTSVAMMVCAVGYLAYSALSVGYAWDKTLVVLVMCVFKLVDAVEDVFHGDYQRQGRLDIGAKILTYRMATTMVLFVVALIVSHELLFSLMVATVFTSVFFVVSTLYVYRQLNMPPLFSRAQTSAVFSLLKDCFPLFLGSFLLFYIGNAPKYAIDACMTDEAQALFGFISMPVFVVGLLSGFVYNPVIFKLSQNWKEGKLSHFMREVGKQSAAIVFLTLACLSAAWLLGLPVLNFLYNTDLSPYLNDLLILVAGGGFYAFIGLFMTIITIIRFQKSLVVGFSVIAVVAAMISPGVVGSFGIAGAAWEYFILMGLLTLIFALLLFVGIRAKKA